MWPMLIMGAINAGLGIYSGFKQKEAADANAELIKQQAENDFKAAKGQGINLAKQRESFLSSQEAGYAKSGVKTDTGTPLQVMKESKNNFNLDITNIERQGYDAFKLGYSNADLLKKQGKDALTTSIIKGGLTLMGNAYSPEKNKWFWEG